MLNSERRAREREAFELKLKQKEAEMEGAKRELEARKKREQEEEVARLRKEAVLRAQPIRSDFIIGASINKVSTEAAWMEHHISVPKSRGLREV